MAELVDATDLKSVGACPRAGSIPAFRTIKTPLFKGCFFVWKSSLKEVLSDPIFTFIDFFLFLC